MKVQEIKEMAKNMGIPTLKMNKADMIRAIQRGENNIDCYGTERVDSCQEQSCSWRNDCLALNNK